MVWYRDIPNYASSKGCILLAVAMCSGLGVEPSLRGLFVEFIVYQRDETDWDGTIGCSCQPKRLCFQRGGEGSKRDSIFSDIVRVDATVLLVADICPCKLNHLVLKFNRCALDFLSKRFRGVPDSHTNIALICMAGAFFHDKQLF